VLSYLVFVVYFVARFREFASITDFCSRGSSAQPAGLQVTGMLFWKIIIATRRIAGLAQTCLYVVNVESRMNCPSTSPRGKGYLLSQERTIPQDFADSDKKTSTQKYLCVITARYRRIEGETLVSPRLRHEEIKAVPFTLPLSILAVLDPNWICPCPHVSSISFQKPVNPTEHGYTPLVFSPSPQTPILGHWREGAIPVCQAPVACPVSGPRNRTSFRRGVL